MLALILFILLVLAIVVAFELRERKRKKSENVAEASSSVAPDPSCCGEHLVCERETLLSTSPEIVYYDDEQLDKYASRQAESYSDAEIADFNEVFTTLKETDVAGWCRSLQMRNICLPLSVREEALLIVREQRSRSAKQKIHTSQG